MKKHFQGSTMFHLFLNLSEFSFSFHYLLCYDHPPHPQTVTRLTQVWVSGTPCWRLSGSLHSCILSRLSTQARNKQLKDRTHRKGTLTISHNKRKQKSKETHPPFIAVMHHHKELQTDAGSNDSPSLNKNIDTRILAFKHPQNLIGKVISTKEKTLTTNIKTVNILY